MIISQAFSFRAWNRADKLKRGKEEEEEKGEKEEEEEEAEKKRKRYGLQSRKGCGPSQQ